MSITAVRAYLAQFGLDSKVLEFPVSSATVELAAEAAGVIPARIAKISVVQGGRRGHPDRHRRGRKSG